MDDDVDADGAADEEDDALAMVSCLYDASGRRSNQWLDKQAGNQATR
jgi:hypothetical protein